MTNLVELNRDYPGFVSTGTGDAALVCEGGRRILLFASMAHAMAAKDSHCGRGCNLRHTAHDLEPSQLVALRKAARIFGGFEPMEVIEAEEGNAYSAT